MNLRKILIILFNCPLIFGQDVHWSIPERNPLGLNPTNTGNFKGDIRFISNYKDQWRSVTKPYNTLNLSIDGSINKKISLGGVIMHDITGDGKYRTIEIGLLPSYTLFSSKKLKIIGGLSLNLNYKQITPSNFKFDNQFDGYMYQEFLASNEVFQTSSQLNINTGIGIQVIVNNNSLGFSLYNINQPEQGFLGATIKRPIRLMISYQTLLNPNGIFQYTPSFVYQKQSVYSELLSGIKSSYKIGSKKLKAIELGLNIRFKDALIPYFGFEFNKLNIGIGYDINTSSLNLASRNRGGTEIYLQYIFVKPPIKNLEHRKCKDFL